VSELLNMISILFPLVHDKAIRENSLLNKNLTVTYHSYTRLVSYHFLKCTEMYKTSLNKKSLNIRTKLYHWPRFYLKAVLLNAFNILVGKFIM
jgi:hypothetical protein